MNDPIADIIYKALYNETSPRPMLAESTAEQIRQHIGRELLEHEWFEVFPKRTTREVCKMEES